MKTGSFKDGSFPPSLLTSGIALTYLILIASNLRWKHIGDLFVSSKKRQPKQLPVTVVEGDSPKEKNDSTKKKIIVVLLHGMWHNASYFSNLQKILKQNGYTSYAIDLLPGERLFPGFSQTEIVSDLENTLLQYTKTKDHSQQNVEFILVGHSQGGLIAQSCLLNSSRLKTHTKATILLGSFPLGLTPPIQLLFQPQNMYNHFGYLGICLTGRLWTHKYLKHIFLLPSTDVNKSARLQTYAQKILNAPSDGLITMSHFPQNVNIISTKPTLILGADQDIIYPPQFLQKSFKDRFPNSDHIIIPNQAHCFMDPVNDGEMCMEDSLISWLDNLFAK